MRGLYAIVDVRTLASRGMDPVAFAEAVLTVRPAAMQLRAKDVTPRDALSLLGDLVPLCRAAGVPLVVNDRPDWATAAGCPMVHLGQDDMAVDEVRRVAPGVGVGLSTHSLEQLDRALAVRPAYVAFGPVFETSSKADASPVVGTQALALAHARAVAAGVPLVAIGGITSHRAATLVGATDAVAVIGALVPERSAEPEGRFSGAWLDEVVERARALHALFSRASG
jgi:thiamine-phosphate pyrophosphorylase